MELSARIRASDQDRDEAVLALGEHHAAGRLTVAEFTSRMEQALACTYLDELDPLFVDLPSIRSGAVPAPAVPTLRAGRPPVVMLAMPVLVAFAVVMVGAGIFFPFWLPVVLFWMMGGPHRHRRMQRSTSWVPHGHQHRRW